MRFKDNVLEDNPVNDHANVPDALNVDVCRH